MIELILIRLSLIILNSFHHIVCSFGKFEVFPIVCLTQIDVCFMHIKFELVSYAPLLIYIIVKNNHTRLNCPEQCK